MNEPQDPALRTALKTITDLVDLLRSIVKAHDEGSNVDPEIRAKDFLEMFDGLRTRARPQ